MNTEILNIDHHNRVSLKSGNKIPITVIEAVYKDPDDNSIVLLRETAVIGGHNIPSDQLNKIKEALREVLKKNLQEGIINGSIKPIRGTQ